MLNPVEFDTQLAALQSTVAELRYKYGRAVQTLRACFDSKAKGGDYTLTVKQLVARCEESGRAASFAKDLKIIDKAPEQIEDLSLQIMMMNRNYREHGNWSRFYLVQNTGGHIHSSLDCSTCFPTTSFGWLTDMSGKTEEDAVAEHGAKLCTVCFPSAPVEWTNFWELEEAKNASEFCSASGTTRWAQAPDMSYVYPRGTCECGASVSPTSKTTGKIRKHKTA